MKFILHELKLWFHEKNQKAKSYEFLPNKINVITGASTTGKTSFWNIIDYCLLAGKENIASEVNDKVKWFGIRFSINNKEITIIRRSKLIMLFHQIYILVLMDFLWNLTQIL
ncbi:hypothetical protein M2R48_18360 [Acinetobacter sp. I-MWF]|uniref:hypothetical protein n=1 Tax=Acinetobacter sp. I-MWF TaxID=2940517 RepID=UPI0021C5ADC1|nr:hypothetical protein [Acinetobacter sp. I-MWF]MCT9980294.1 hypothetical protein [Acinetobacter sp. I-MWF]